MIRVMIVDDSPTTRAMIRAILQEDPQVQVVGEADNGLKAIQMAGALRPDVITMDIIMPEMDGLEATREIMIESPTRIVVITGHLSAREVRGSLQALQSGALTVLPKPPAPDHALFAQAKAQLIRTIKAMSSVKVVRHWREKNQEKILVRRPTFKPDSGRRFQVVAIASSTGGPAALQQIFASLPRDYPAPVLVVQHMPVGFTPGLADWLNASSTLKVTIAQAQEKLVPGRVYLAPENRHLGVSPAGDSILLSSREPIEGFQPSATFLFASVTQVFGSAGVGVILTGMGRDGIEGLRLLHEAGGWVIAQDEATSVVYGMPREAVVAGLANSVLPIEKIAQELTESQFHVHARA